MASINLRGVGFVARVPLFKDLTTVISDGERLGLIAGNGGGKSTLLQCLGGKQEPTTGEITRSRGLRVALVEQDLPSGLLDLTFAEAIRRAIPTAERETQAWRVNLVLDEFETPSKLRDRTVRALSGGWQRLALIARAWITDPDALLLDEPTNHLDLAKIQWLERWIVDACGGIPMVIASHDRQFLDTCTTRTLFLRPETCRAYDHPYGRARQLLAEDEAADAAKHDRDLREAERLRRSAGALRNIGINSRSDAAQKKSAQLARRAEAIEQSLRQAHIERSGQVRLANSGTHARVLLALADVTVRTPDGQSLFRIGKLEVRQGDRIVVLGRNGTGKSQLVGLVRCALNAPDETPGIKASPSLAVGYLDQQMSQLPDEATPHGFISGTFRQGDQRSLSLLAGAGFTLDMQRQAIARLSPGQKARLGLLALRLAEPNFYLLDEPTNHLDIAGQEALEAEILAHEASCIVVSHDRSFVRTVGTRFMVIDSGKLVEVEAPEAFYRTLTNRT
jgi:ATPase subunit of ABC transporter with duplicated ATPase domains